MTSPAPQIVWLKRDLRVHDHAPLWHATRHGPVVGLYIYEPEILESPIFDSAHLRFINDSLTQVRDALAEHNIHLITRHGEATHVLDALHHQLGFDAIWSHEETGNLMTYARDKRVKRWCDDADVTWHQIQQHGVSRPHPHRDGWAMRWRTFVESPQAPDLSGAQRWMPPEDLHTEGITAHEDLGVPPNTRETQCGGSSHGLDLLESFLEARSHDYRRAMSDPNHAWTSCSRLSAHIAFGTVSLRRIYQTNTSYIEELRAQEAIDEAHLASLDSFESRLAWHCHFMQKLEDEPEIEVRNMNRAFDGMRQEAPSQWTPEERARYEAWCAGRTGYPMIDAAMQALRQTGWLNFRLRAMLVSFGAYHLWLHWKPLARHLGRLFLDYEPGIHYSQHQMQSGVTGINAIRIYNPIKQAIEKDPEGSFIAEWCPELSQLPLPYRFEPYKMPLRVQQHYGCILGEQYPEPLVDEAAARTRAAKQVFARRETARAAHHSKKVLHKHGSRHRRGRHMAGRGGSQRASTLDLFER